MYLEAGFLKNTVGWVVLIVNLVDSTVTVVGVSP